MFVLNVMRSGYSVDLWNIKNLPEINTTRTKMKSHFCTIYRKDCVGCDALSRHLVIRIWLSEQRFNSKLNNFLGLSWKYYSHYLLVPKERKNTEPWNDSCPLIGCGLEWIEWKIGHHTRDLISEPLSIFFRAYAVIICNSRVQQFYDCFD